MPSPSPWSIKGISPEARQLAKAAAKRSGKTLGEWMSERIFDDHALEPAESVSDDVIQAAAKKDLEKNEPASAPDAVATRETKTPAERVKVAPKISVSFGRSDPAQNKSSSGDTSTAAPKAVKPEEQRVTQTPAAEREQQQEAQPSSIPAQQIKVKLGADSVKAGAETQSRHHAQTPTVAAQENKPEQIASATVDTASPSTPQKNASGSDSELSAAIKNIAFILDDVQKRSKDNETATQRQAALNDELRAQLEDGAGRVDTLASSMKELAQSVEITAKRSATTDTSIRRIAETVQALDETVAASRAEHAETLEQIQKLASQNYAPAEEVVEQVFQDPRLPEMIRGVVREAMEEVVGGETVRQSPAKTADEKSPSVASAEQHGGDSELAPASDASPEAFDLPETLEPEPVEMASPTKPSEASHPETNIESAFGAEHLDDEPLTLTDALDDDASLTEPSESRSFVGWGAASEDVAAAATLAATEAQSDFQERDAGFDAQDQELQFDPQDLTDAQDFDHPKDERHGDNDLKDKGAGAASWSELSWSSDDQEAEDRPSSGVEGPEQDDEFGETDWRAQSFENFTNTSNRDDSLALDNSFFDASSAETFDRYAGGSEPGGYGFADTSFENDKDLAKGPEVYSRDELSGRTPLDQELDRDLEAALDAEIKAADRSASFRDASSSVDDPAQPLGGDTTPKRLGESTEIQGWRTADEWRQLGSDEAPELEERVAQIGDDLQAADTVSSTTNGEGASESFDPLDAELDALMAETLGGGHDSRADEPNKLRPSVGSWDEPSEKAGWKQGLDTLAAEIGGENQPNHARNNENDEAWSALETASVTEAAPSRLRERLAGRSEPSAQGGQANDAAQMIDAEDAFDALDAAVEDVAAPKAFEDALDAAMENFDKERAAAQLSSDFRRTTREVEEIGASPEQLIEDAAHSLGEPVEEAPDLDTALNSQSIQPAKSASEALKRAQESVAERRNSEFDLDEDAVPGFDGIAPMDAAESKTKSSSQVSENQTKPDSPMNAIRAARARRGSAPVETDASPEIEAPTLENREMKPLRGAVSSEREAQPAEDLFENDLFEEEEASSARLGVVIFLGLLIVTAGGAITYLYTLG